MPLPFQTSTVFARFGAAIVLCIGLGACASGPTADPGDPLEGVNRAMHTFNKGVDQVALRPLSKAYGYAVPTTIKHVINNEVRFLSLPVSLVNALLQGNLDRAGDTAARLWVNGTLGGLGALDPATEIGIPEHYEDFGQTLAVWGVGSGPYLELPLLGPNSLRAAVGSLVDIGFDPLTYAGGSAGSSAVGLSRRGADIIDTRHRYSDVLDQVLYESEDSYTAVKNVYRQRRNSAILNGEIDAEALPDIYEVEPF